MQLYTVRFAHLESLPEIQIGSLIRRGNVIGRMGNTGSSHAPHLHYDIVKGYQTKMYRLKDIEFDTDTIRQLGLFNDEELFGYPIITTAYFGDPKYLDKHKKWKMHPAYDVVPENRHMYPGRNSDIHWNRSIEGHLLRKGVDSGYGNYIMVGYCA